MFLADLKTKWLRSSIEELKSDEEYLKKFRQVLLESVADKAGIECHIKNKDALEFMINAHSDKFFLRNLSDEHIDEQRKFFATLYPVLTFWVQNG